MPFGPVASLTWGNGVTDARTFDLDYRMTSVKDVGTGKSSISATATTRTTTSTPSPTT